MIDLHSVVVNILAIKHSIQISNDYYTHSKDFAEIIKKFDETVDALYNLIKTRRD